MDQRKKAVASFASVIVIAGVAAGVRVAFTDTGRHARDDDSQNAYAPPPPSPEPEVPPTAKFEFQNRIPGYQTSFYVLGFVTNTSPFAVDKPKVTAVLHGANGAEVGTADGFADADWLEAGAKSPVKVLVQNPPAFQEMTFEVVASRASAHTPAAEALRVDVLQAPHEVMGSWEVTGKIHNGGQSAARFVNVRVLAYDAAGRLVGLDNTYADGQSLPAGADARFRITPLYDKAPQRFEYFVSAQLAN